MKLSLKTINTPFISFFVFLNIAFFWLMITNTDLSVEDLNEIWTKASYGNNIAALGLSLIVFLINGILSSHIKEILVFWRIKNPLPGHRCFTKLIYKDHRINVAELRKKLGQFPIDPIEQNNVWYKLYRTHQNKLRVLSAHRRYLLARDLAAISFIMLISGVLACLLNNVEQKHYLYELYLLFQFIVISLVGRNEGNRFAANVLVEEAMQ